jgi:hypothetical protein
MDRSSTTGLFPLGVATFALALVSERVSSGSTHSHLQYPCSLTTNSTDVVGGLGSRDRVTIWLAHLERALSNTEDEQK